MENMNKKIQCIALVIMCLSILYFGVHMESVEKMKEKNMIRVSVVLPHSDDGYWSNIEKGILEGEADYSDRVDVQIHIPQLNYNIDQMVELIKRQTAAKVDAIIVQGNENKEYVDALIGARNQGIQIVLVDTDILIFPPHLYVGTNNYEAGVLMGEKLAEITGGEAKVAVLSGEAGYANLQERCQGLAAISEKYPLIEFIRLDYDNYDGLTVMNKYNEIHGENPEIDTLVCVEGTGGQTLGAVFKEEQSEYQNIVVFDITEETQKGLKNGIVDGIVSQDTNQMGYQAIKEIVKYMDEGKYSNNCIYTKTGWIASETIEEEEAYE